MTERPIEMIIDRRVMVFSHAIVAAGIIIRVAVYLYKRSLWLDESMLALNVFNRSYAGLLQRLDMDQIAPPLFLFASKFIHSLWGELEYSLRLLPLLSGCLTLYLLGRFFRRFMPDFFALCALIVRVRLLERRLGDQLQAVCLR